jgi:hypothetical protein
MSKLKIGIVGCGNIANTKHLPNLAKFADRAEVVAFCDVIEEKAVKTKEKWGAPDAKVFKDYRDLIKLDLDAVHVCTPNRSHSEITVVMPRRDHAQLRGRILHDRTSRKILKALGRYEHVDIAVVPYFFAKQRPPARAADVPLGQAVR